MIKPAICTLTTLLLAALAGCRPMATARYTGPANPLENAALFAQANSAQGDVVVRGQNGNEPGPRLVLPEPGSCA